MERKDYRILYYYVKPRSFIQTDLDQLASQYRLTPKIFTSEPKWITPFSFLFQAVYLLVFGWRFQAIACFFAGYHSLLPALFARLTGKPCILFLAGSDCFKYPSFRYGNFTKPLYGIATCWSARLASLLAPVSGNLVRRDSRYYRVDSTEQGIYHWCKGLSTPNRIIHFEYDPGKFRPLDVPRDPAAFITIAFGIGGTSYVRKGVDKTLMLATRMPECRFTIVGSRAEDFPASVPGNVTIIPPVPHDEIPKLLCGHQFYLQLSIAEGFPSAVCEAMLCECIPIGSNVAAIPEIIGDCGFLVEEREDEEIIETVRKALHVPDKSAMARAAREHIIRHFGPGTRISELRQLFST